MTNSAKRHPDEMREVTITRHYTKHAEGSVLVEFGDTKVLCTASVADKVPGFLRGTGKGWVTAEYGMLPRSTHSRMRRESAAGKQSGRTVEIQRLIGRSLRAAVDLEALGELSITVDCDVLQADGGTRTASITGASVALADAFQSLIEKKVLKADPMQHLIAAVSVGVVGDKLILDLDYEQDSSAETDMNVVMTSAGGFVEIQGTAEGKTFSEDELAGLLALAKSGINSLFKKQRQSLERD